MNKQTVLRVARPTDHLDEVIRFYTEGVGLSVLGSFMDHEGFDGVMVGIPSASYHLDSRVSAACPPTGCTLVRFGTANPGPYGVTESCPDAALELNDSCAIQVIARHSTSATCSIHWNHFIVRRRTNAILRPLEL